MKFLLNTEKKAIRRGEFVKADQSAGEVIMETGAITDDKEYTVAVLHEIAKANSIPAPKNSSRADLIENLSTNLEKMKMAEQNTPTQSDIIKDIVTQAGESRVEGTDSDEFEVSVFTTCITKLNELGITFKIKQLGNLVKNEIASQGLVVSNAQRRDMANEILEGEGFNPETWDDVEAMLETLTTEVQDTDRKQALSILRKFCKTNEIELPKRTAAKKAVGGFRKQAIDFMIQNSPCNEADLLAFVTDSGRKDPEKTTERLLRMKEMLDSAVDHGRSLGQTAEAA